MKYDLLNSSSDSNMKSESRLVVANTGTSIIDAIDTVSNKIKDKIVTNIIVESVLDRKFVNKESTPINAIWVPIDGMWDTNHVVGHMNYGYHGSFEGTLTDETGNVHRFNYGW